MEYKKEWYNKDQELTVDEWEDNGFVFVIEYAINLNPITISTWLLRVEEKNKSLHLNAHAFRCSIASALNFDCVDPILVAYRLRHN